MIVAPGPLGPACSLNAEFYPHHPFQTKDRINAFRKHADLFNAEDIILNLRFRLKTHRLRKLLDL
jgi:hypothetical protein